MLLPGTRAGRLPFDRVEPARREGALTRQRHPLWSSYSSRTASQSATPRRSSLGAGTSTHQKRDTKKRALGDRRQDGASIAKLRTQRRIAHSRSTELTSTSPPPQGQNDYGVNAADSRREWTKDDVRVLKSSARQKTAGPKDREVKHTGAAPGKSVRCLLLPLSRHASGLCSACRSLMPCKG